jgi:uncharacterized membrane protein YhaH (DUF805 family)
MRSTNPYAAPVNDFAWEVAEGADRESWLEQNFLWLLFSFRRRIPRMAYWAASVVVTIFHNAAVFIATRFIKEADTLVAVNVLLALPMLWSTLAITVKRYHDRDKSAWWLLIALIPIIGPLWMLIELGFLRGSYGPNNYGREA